MGRGVKGRGEEWRGEQLGWVRVGAVINGSEGKNDFW